MHESPVQPQMDFVLIQQTLYNIFYNILTCKVNFVIFLRQLKTYKFAFNLTLICTEMTGAVKLTTML